MTIYVYAGYYELFVTPKKLEKPYMYQGEFESVEEAEAFLTDNFDIGNNKVYYERSIFPQSKYYIEFLSYDEMEEYCCFDVTEDGLVLQALNSEC